MGREHMGILYNEPASMDQPFWEASRDVLTQLEAIESALARLGYAPVRIPFTRHLGLFTQRLKDNGVKRLFNLCETVEEDPTLIGHPAAALELLGVAFSGSPSLSLMLTTDKLLTKRVLKAGGIRTPNYLVYDGIAPFDPGRLRFPVIVKPRFEDASIGIDQESVFSEEGELRKGVGAVKERFGTLLVEEFIEGREFNVSLWGYPSPRVLPVAEIDFSEFPAGLHRIVGYRAKWDKASFEYRHSRRTFPESLPAQMRAKMEVTALECFRLFMLRDYARVDVRVDPRGRIYVLEVNANPCLSPDAGLAASAEKAGMGYSQVVADLAAFVMQRSSENGHQVCCFPG